MAQKGLDDHERGLGRRTVMSMAFPQLAPGSAPSPGPMVVPADQLRSKLGLSTVTVMQGNKPLAFVDKTLAG